MRPARLLLAELLAFAVALGIFAVAAVACEGGGGGPELTSLSTKLSGEGKEGEELTVLDGSEVKDKATLSGKNASKATGKVTYKVYSDKECKTLVTSAGEVTDSGETVPASSGEELEGGKTYYWQAHYGGDANNAESTSPCTEILTVKPVTCTFPFCEPTITPGVKLNVLMRGDCTAGPIMTKSTEAGKKFLLTAGHCLGPTTTTTKGVTQIVQSAYPAAPTKEKEIGHEVTYNDSKSYDTGEVEIENAEWMPGGVVPPLLVEWKVAPAVTSVIGNALNDVNEETCLSGARSGGVSCGVVLATGRTVAGVAANLVETNVSGEPGDSGAPEFVPVPGEGVRIQGTYVAKLKSNAFGGEVDVKMNSDVITGLPEGKNACKKVTGMKELWLTVPIEGAGILPGTNVEECTEQVGGTANITMSEKATENGTDVKIAIGRTQLSLYEPMSRIEEVYPGQKLLTK